MEYDATRDPRARTQVTDFEPGDWVRVIGDAGHAREGVVTGSTAGNWLRVNTHGGGQLQADPTRQTVLLLERCGVPSGLERVDSYKQLCSGDLIYRLNEDWVVVGEWGSVTGQEGLPAVRPTNTREVHYLQHDNTTWLVDRTPAKPLVVVNPCGGPREVAAKHADRIRIENPTVKVKAPPALLDALVVAYEQLTTANRVLETLHERITGEGESAVDDAVVPTSVQQLARRVAELAGAANAWATQLDGAVGHDDVQGALATERVAEAHDAVYAAE
jgi:hypothetical protein